MKLTCTYTASGKRKDFQIDGKEVTEEEYDAASPKHEVGGGMPYIAAPWRWPRVSEAAGCHPKQVKIMQEAYAKLGVNTEFTPTGEAIFRTKEHEKAHLKASQRHNEAYL